jgi:tetratricopeptide (TPR) repeat protein
MTYERALAIAVETGDRRWEGNAHCNLGLLHHEQGHGALAKPEFDNALRVARELGHARLETMVLCNLGIVLEADGSLEEACGYYEQAIAHARELLDRRSEGQFSGYVGALYARLGRIADARACLAAGEALLTEVSDRMSLALLLCQRAQAEQIAGDPGAAREAIAGATKIAEEMQAGGDSTLARRLEALRTQPMQVSR